MANECWHVSALLDTPVEDVLEVLARHNLSGLGPTEVTRMVKGSSGLLVHNDPEHSWCCFGPDNLPEILKEEPLITSVIRSQPVG